MSRIRLADLRIHWTGVDDTTPKGHVLVSATDSTGSLRLCLYAGTVPSDDSFRGSLLIPSDNHGQNFLPSQTTAYGPTGAFVSTHGDQTDMLARLARHP
ncbi:hypothetical protein [Streptomyces albidoflavus]|uniref:hypothetical protein n=1 Tax=Streptomyces albidoflavus TaxID=1886 RepID=UPI00101FF6FE|nr:hypothetical protein [Streptomyces albidoflavus]RZF02918.1 hypothetical protein C0R05_32420 [Streptomyces albidoflavus]